MAVQSEATAATAKPTTIKNLPLLIFNAILMTISGCGAPILTRIYFTHGGSRIWLLSLTQNIGFPIILLPLATSYFCRRRRSSAPSDTAGGMSAAVFWVSAVLGLLSGIICYLYAYGSSLLPASTSNLVMSSQLGFTAVFALLIVRQRFTPFTTNAVVLLVLGSVVLGTEPGGSDRPEGESSGRYLMGFLMMVATAAAAGLYTPLVELMYVRMVRSVTYTLVMKVQLVMGGVGTAFCLVGSLVSKDFQAIPAEARAFSLGETKYYLILGFTSLMWQFFGLGMLGTVAYSSSLVSGIISAALTPLGLIAPLILLHENFNSEKGISAVLCVWGFVSYSYGEWKLQQERKKAAGIELLTPQGSSC